MTAPQTPAARTGLATCELPGRSASRRARLHVNVRSSAKVRPARTLRRDAAPAATSRSPSSRTPGAASGGRREGGGLRMRPRPPCASTAPAASLRDPAAPQDPAGTRAAATGDRPCPALPSPLRYHRHLGTHRQRSHQAYRHNKQGSGVDLSPNRKSLQQTGASHSSWPGTLRSHKL